MEASWGSESALRRQPLGPPGQLGRSGLDLALLHAACAGRPASVRPACSSSGKGALAIPTSQAGWEAWDETVSGECAVAGNSCKPRPLSCRHRGTLVLRGPMAAGPSHHFLIYLVL